MRETWDVLLLGGPSGIGKTTAALALAGRYGVTVAPVDDVVAAVREMTTPHQYPALHFWWTHPEAVDWPAEQILQLQLGFARALEPALAAVLRARMDGEPPGIIEGDCILPGLAPSTSPLAQSGRVRAVFLYEPEQDAIRANLERREPGDDHTKRARVSWLYGRWLADEARRQDLPAITVRPWADQLDRITAAIGTVA